MKELDLEEETLKEKTKSLRDQSNDLTKAEDDFWQNVNCYERNLVHFNDGLQGNEGKILSFKN